MSKLSVYEPRLYNCLSCGAATISVAPDHANDQDYCGVCRFLREIKDPVERERLCARLHRQDMS